MKRKLLEDMGLTKEQVDKILDENSQDIGKAKNDADQTTAKLTAAESEVTSLKGQLTERDTQLETLKNSTGDIEALKGQITKLQTENQEKDSQHASELQKLRREAIDDGLLDKAKNPTVKQALKSLLEKIEDNVDDEAYKTLRSKQVKELTEAEETKDFFMGDKSAKQDKRQGYDPKKGEQNDTSLAKVMAEEMNKETLSNPYEKAWG